MRPTRRHLLTAAGAFATAAVAGTAVVGAASQVWWNQPHDSATRHLSRDEIDFCDALADAIFPPSPDLPLRGAEAGVGRFFDTVLDGMAPFQRKMLRLGLHALDQWPRPTHGRPFRELAGIEAIAVLDGWVHSDIAELRGLVASVYIFVAMAYTVHPDVSAVLSRQFLCGYGD